MPSDLPHIGLPGTTPQQLTLDLPARTAMGREDFLVASCNRDAVGWIDRWPDNTQQEARYWPAPLLVLYGPEASGKTHLARVWQHRTRAIWGAAEEAASDEFHNRIISTVGQGQAVCLDINGAIGDERQLFHACNWAKEHRGTILVTGRTPPRDWPLTLPDLRSRVLAAPAARLEEPDDALLTAVFVKLFNDRQLLVSEAVVTYILTRLERSFAAVRSAAERLDQAALSAQKGVTIPLARQVLGL